MIFGDTATCRDLGFCTGAETYPTHRPSSPTKFMNCHQLAQRLHELQPSLPPTDVARLTLMILNQTSDESLLVDDEKLTTAWRSASFRLEAASDQHAAVAEELDSLCSDGPIEFSPDQLWVLLRAVRVQGQILELYTDQPSLA